MKLSMRNTWSRLLFQPDFLKNSNASFNGKVTCYLCTTVSVFYFYDRNSGRRNRQDWNSRIILMPSWCSDRKKLKNDQRAYFYFQAIDAGDTIFVHTFGAYFGLGVSRILYTKSTLDHKNEVKNIFLWLTPCGHGLFLKVFCLAHRI